MTKDTPTDSQADEWLDEILNTVRWGDYQREDGLWGRGIANRPLIKATIQTKLAEAEQAAEIAGRIDELRKVLELQKSPDKSFKVYDQWLMDKVEEHLAELQHRQASNKGEIDE